MIKKYGTYLAALLVGLTLGYLVFGTGEDIASSEHNSRKNEVQNWTCSMHPQVDQVEKGECPICGMDLVSVNTSESELAPNQFRMSENALALANIETLTVGVGDIENGSLKLSGVIKTNEKTNAVQTTIFDGRIEKLNVNYVGEYVKKGQQIGLIYSPNMYTAQDQMLTNSSYRETQKKLWAATRNMQGLWKLTDEQVNEIIRTGKPMENFPLIADVSGTVTEVLASEGKFYKEGDPLYKVSNLYTVWAVFDAYENQLPMLNMGQDITITSKSFEGKRLKAKISFIEPILDASKRTVSVRVTLNNKEQLLKPGMFVEGTVKVDGASQVLTVPKSAVLWTGKRSLVYRKPQPDEPVFEMAEVTLGNAVGGSYVILEGLTAGDEVVVNGTFTIDAAAQLQGKRSMMDNGRKIREINKIEDGVMIGLELGESFRKNFLNLVGRYTMIKDALIEADSKKSSKRADDFQKALENIEIGTLNQGVQLHLQKMQKAVRSISKTSDIEEQRKYFKPLSESMVAIASNLNDLDQPIYVQFCPMANNNEGGNWLSFESEVRNPYFGDKMLTCGSVIRTIE